jgi:hypothetical protein
MMVDEVDEERELMKLDEEAIKRGLQGLAEEHPEHLADFLREEEDAITGDVFVQLCVFGELVYG